MPRLHGDYEEYLEEKLTESGLTEAAEGLRAELRDIQRINDQRDRLLDQETRPLCTTCKGRGWVYSALDLGGDKDCPTCKGSGWGATARRNSETTYEGDTT